MKSGWKSTHSLLSHQSFIQLKSIFDLIIHLLSAILFPFGASWGYKWTKCAYAIILKSKPLKKTEKNQKEWKLGSKDIFVGPHSSRVWLLPISNHSYTRVTNTSVNLDNNSGYHRLNSTLICVKTQQTQEPWGVSICVSHTDMKQTQEVGAAHLAPRHHWLPLITDCYW